VNLETRLSTELWEAVRTNYEKRNFTGAVLDAFYFLSDLLRKKSGAEGDGASLIGHALGGATPRIKLNKLQSESEWSVQKGIEQLLRGFYQACRNPRSHEKIVDAEDDAQVLILFIDYLVRQIGQAKSQFSREDFLKRILDADFVPQRRYAELLASEIPVGLRLEVFLDVYRAKSGGKPENLHYFFNVLLPQLSEGERKQVDEVISEELRTVEDESEIRNVIRVFSGDIWPGIAEDARLRIENRLVRSIQEGRYESGRDRCRSGALGTWAVRLFPHFSLKEEALDAIEMKLWADAREEVDYVLTYLFSHLGSLSATMPSSLDEICKYSLNEGDEMFYKALRYKCPWKRDTWSTDLAKALDDFKAAESATNTPDDDIPF
jgi:uncharacterized protein (TIGR02391 family)